jgi:hypothetical protein
MLVRLSVSFLLSAGPCLELLGGKTLTTATATARPITHQTTDGYGNGKTHHTSNNNHSPHILNERVFLKYILRDVFFGSSLFFFEL